VKIGVSSWSLLNADLDSAVKAIGDAGFEYIEVWGEVPHAYHDWVDAKRLKDTLSAYDMVLTLHAPFTDLNIASPFQPVRAAVAKTMDDFVRFGIRLGASIITVHPGSVHNIALVSNSTESAVQIIRGMVKTSEGRIAISIENQARSSSKYLFPLASTVESLEQMLSAVEGTRFTLDTGHAHVSGLDPVALAQRFGSRFVEVHLSDNCGTSDDHMILGQGTANLDRFVEWASKTDALMCLELDPHKYSQQQVIEAALKVKARVSKGPRAR
jgi:sugar phosphate isomerase/epimerase